MALVDVVMGDSGVSFGAIDFSELEITLPEINNVYPPPPVPPLSDFIVPQQTIAAAFMSGLWTGVKANVNGLSSAVVSTATLGIIDKVEPMKVTDLDRAYGYDTAAGISQFSGTLLVGLGSGGLGCWSKGGSAMVRTVGTTVRMMDIGGNVVGAGKNAHDIYENGASYGNVLGFAGNMFGIVGNVSQACFTEGTQIVVGMEYDENDNFVSYVTMNIEDIEAGDYVYSYNTLTGETELCEVTQTYVRTADHINILTVEDENGIIQAIETTDSHPFWVVTDDPDFDRAARSVVDENGVTLYHENLEPGLNGFWVEAKDLQVGDVFLGADGELSTLVQSCRTEHKDGVTVYNFEVTDNHNYFIIARDDEYGQTCVLVHNAGYDDWSPGNNFTSELNAEIHFNRHAHQFPMLETAEEYAELAAKARDKALPSMENWSKGKDIDGFTSEVKRFFLKDGTYIDLEKPIPPSTVALVVSFGRID